MSDWYNNKYIAVLLALLLVSMHGHGQEDEVIKVIGVTPTEGIGLPKELIPFNVQSATDEDLERSQSFDLTDFLNRNLGSVTINNAQNNPLQSDVQYRGYTLSPLLGLPQGLAAYQNGVRINEPFGDSINWDLIPESSIAGVNLMGGANPVFGLNALGGALAITTKTGFTHPGHSLEIQGGSYERVLTTLESGANNGTWGYYFTGNYFDEDGWRDASPSDALNFFGALSYEAEATAVDININHANTDLIGNGPAPVELLARGRNQIFTSPDQTENELIMVSAQATHWLNDRLQLSANTFYRDNQTDSFNGDGSEFEECDEEAGGTAGELCEEDESVSITDQTGMSIPVSPTGREAINNTSRREQQGFGGDIQITATHDLAGRANQFSLGAGYQQGLIDFFSRVEVASLLDDRSTMGRGLFVPESGVNIKARNRIWSIYASNTFSVNEQLAITASARYNNSHIVLTDRGAFDPLAEENSDLNGDHDFDRVNPAIGFTYKINQNIGAYGGYGESARAPTPIELLCADPDAPCSLPNAFLADPPLQQVVNKSFEGGFRGRLDNGISYHVGGFHGTNEDDILFGTTGGLASNEGFFTNVGDTLRVGAELGLKGVFRDRLDWYLNYSFVDATFDTAFESFSANHPINDDDDDDADSDAENNTIQVEAGDRIPGIPQHSLKLGADYTFNERLSIGANMIYNSNQVVRGDESNQSDTIDGYAIVNLHGSYKINPNLTVMASIRNLFDTDYETFGLFGEPDELPGFGEDGRDFDDSRFLGPGAPISAYIGLRLRF